MDQTSPVRDVMTTDVVTFAPTDTVEHAIRTLVDHDIDAAPVVDTGGDVVGMISTADLIARSAEIHLPAMVDFLGAVIQFGHRRFENDMHDAFASTVGELMTDHVVSVEEHDTIQRAATLMHDHEVSRLPVVERDRLVGIVSRNDILRALLSEA
jgi:CBS domain-containing protein